LVPQYSNDKLFITQFILSMVGGLWLSLMSAGFLLAFNINSLMISGIVFTVCSTNWILRAKPTDQQISYVALCVIPIGLRWLLNTPMFTTVSINEPALWVYTAQVVAVWLLVAVSEEAFRATMLNLAELFTRFKDRELSGWAKTIFANAVWVVFHFIQRPFDPVAYKWYLVWLIASGLVMTFAMTRAGLGAATLIHLLVNLSA
jgi:hypothetical protein